MKHKLDNCRVTAPVANIRERWQAVRLPYNCRTKAGFTLLEILLAVAILGLVITAVYSTWSAALLGWKRGTAVADTFQRQRIVMDALSELGSSAVFFGPNIKDYLVTGTHDEGAGDSVSFVTASEALLPPKA